MCNEIRIYTREQYKSDLREELESKGLYKSIEQRMDEISEAAYDLGYPGHRFVQEQLVEILDLVKMAVDQT